MARRASVSPHHDTGIDRIANPGTLDEVQHGFSGLLYVYNPTSGSELQITRAAWSELTQRHRDTHPNARSLLRAQARSKLQNIKWRHGGSLDSSDSLGSLNELSNHPIQVSLGEVAERQVPLRSAPRTPS